MKVPAAAESKISVQRLNVDSSPDPACELSPKLWIASRGLPVQEKVDLE